MDNKVCYEELSAKLLKLLETENYSKSTLYDMKFILKVFSNYVKINGITEYDANIGDKLIAHCRDELHVCASRVVRAKVIVRKLNRLASGLDGREALWSYHISKVTLSENYQILLNKYLSFCLNSGNKSTTVQMKKWVCTIFLHSLSEIGCKDIKDLTGVYVQKAFLSLCYTGYWERIRPFLLYLYQNDVIKCDYTKIIPYRKKKEIFPTIYSPEEITAIEKSVDRNNPSGVRNFAIILLLSRYGIRACDIAALTFDNIDFAMNRISFIQQKNGIPWEAELLPEIKAALLDYINNVRPQNTGHKEIFLTLMIPLKPIDHKVINTMVGEIIKKANVDINGRKHGSRVFRSSLASNMVNDKVSTEVVRKVLGHGTKYALKHYVKIDIERMKLCTLPVPEPTGHFAELLKMKEAE